MASEASLELCKRLRAITGAPLPLCLEAAKRSSSLEEGLAALASMAPEFKPREARVRRFFARLTEGRLEALIIEAHSDNDMGLRSREAEALGHALLDLARSGDRDGWKGALARASAAISERLEAHYSLWNLPAGNLYLYMHESLGPDSSMRGCVAAVGRVSEAALKELAVNVHAALGLGASPSAIAAGSDHELWAKAMASPTLSGRGNVGALEGAAGLEALFLIG